MQLQGMCPDDKMIENGAGSSIRMYGRASWDKEEQKLAFQSGKNMDVNN